jgi:hypothetical protein
MRLFADDDSDYGIFVGALLIAAVTLTLFGFVGTVQWRSAEMERSNAVKISYEAGYEAGMDAGKQAGGRAARTFKCDQALQTQ